MPDIKELLKQYKGKKTVLYGLGTETERALEKFDNYFKIIGLLDGFKDFGEIYGKPIISLSKAVKEATELIIVVARPGSCRVITKRISSFCRENNIALYDIRGKNLLEQSKVSYNFKHKKGGTLRELLNKIDTADIISFDLFDTLVTRKVLAYTDIFEIVDYQLQEKQIVIPDFINRRLASEKELAKYGAPSLVEIYECLLDKLSDKIEITANDLADMEWCIDYETVIPRLAVCNIYQEIINSKKKVFIITDTYYCEKQIKTILRKCGIRDYMGLYVSCEYHTSKGLELFDIFKREQGVGRYLHIGDDWTVDIELPTKYNFDTFHIFSGVDLLDELGYLGVEACIRNFSDRVKIGLFVSGLFNNPFQFETETGEIEVKRSEDIGYLFCAPIICDFLLWFCRQIKESNIKTILFSARDGYLLKKLYEKVKEERSIYFLTSRIAAIRAGMESTTDIAYVESMKFFGTIDENLSVRFGINSDEILSENSIEEGLEGYSNDILENAKVLRRNYEIYIDSLNIQNGDIAFFDFVAKGTTQMYIQKIINHHLKGLYFLQLEPDFMEDKNLDIEPFYSKEIMDDNAIFDDYYILEAVLTAPHSQVLEFDELGMPIYAKETRSKQNIECICEMQEGILDYFKSYISLVPENKRIENKKLDESMLRLIHAFKITDEHFRTLFVEDPFFNRQTRIMDLI